MIVGCGWRQMRVCGYVAYPVRTGRGQALNLDRGTYRSVDEYGSRGSEILPS